MNININYNHFSLERYSIISKKHKDLFFLNEVMDFSKNDLSGHINVSGFSGYPMEQTYEECCYKIEKSKVNFFKFLKEAKFYRDTMFEDFFDLQIIEDAKSLVALKEIIS